MAKLRFRANRFLTLWNKLPRTLDFTHFYSRVFTAVYIILTNTGSLHSLIYRVPECGIFDAAFSVVSVNTKLEGATIAAFPNLSPHACSHKCIEYRNCKSINVQVLPGQTGACHLISKESGDPGVKLISNSGWVHFQTIQEDTQDKVSFKILGFLTTNYG